MNSLIKNSQVFLLFTTLILVTLRNSYLGMDELINISPEECVKGVGCKDGCIYVFKKK